MPALEHGVWFTATPTSDGYLVVDTTQSSYSAGILVLEGTPGSWTPLLCGPGQVIGAVAAGTTYYLLVFGDGTSATSGALVLSVAQAAPPPVIEVTVSPWGTVDKAGAATITGTVTCTSDDLSGVVYEVYGTMRQTVGRIFVDGYFDVFAGAPCDGTPYPWQAYVGGSNGKFAGGKAATVAIGFGCTDLCSEGYAEAVVQLRKGGGGKR